MSQTELSQTGTSKPETNQTGTSKPDVQVTSNLGRILQLQVLLIEDDSVAQESVVRLIGKQFNLRIASLGRDGLEQAQAQRPDCVLLDYRLPDIDGHLLAQSLLNLKLPIVILTVEESPDIIVPLMREGVHDFVMKREMSPAVLARAIQNAVEKARLQQQITMHAERLVEQNQQIRNLASALTLAELRERKRISQILHDHVQQLLYGIHMRAHLLAKDLLETVPPNVEETLNHIIKLVETAVVTTRTLSVELSPPMLKDDSVGMALQWLAAHMERLHGLHVDLQIICDFRMEKEELHILLIQLVRELLFNVVKHANVEQARVSLYSKDRNIMISVEDEGAGFDQGHAVTPKWQPEKGYGLYSVRERIALFGGRLDVDSHPGDGARITIILPGYHAVSPTGAPQLPPA